MNEAHQRFHAWLVAGAEGDPPRDVAVHASVCAGCRLAIAAFDQLALIDPGLASVPPEPMGREPGRLAMTGRLVGATVILFSAAILGVGVSQLIGVSQGGGPVAQASPTPEQRVLGATAAPQPSPGATPSPQAPQETLSPLGTPSPTHANPVVTPIPLRTAPPTPLPTFAPTDTPIPTAAPTDTPVPTAAPTDTPMPTPIPTPTPTPVPPPPTDTPSPTPSASI
jgi:hypothetical protein